MIETILIAVVTSIVTTVAMVSALAGYLYRKYKPLIEQGQQMSEMSSMMMGDDDL